MLLVLLGSAALDDGFRHAHSHWLAILAYAGATGLLAARRFRRGSGPTWLPTTIDAGLVAYVLAEHVLIRTDPVGADAVALLPAFLLLLSSALELDPRRTALYSGLVSAAWGGALATAYALTGPGSPGLGHQLFGLVSFLAASGFVLHGMRALRRAISVALRTERERAFLSRFVPPGTGLRSHGRVLPMERRHACLVSVDIRGFSELSRRHSASEVVSWLLQARAIVNAAVTAEGGTVDKYVGDGVLAQFFAGDPPAQAAAAFRAVSSIGLRFSKLNKDRAGAGLPPIRLIASLHSGTVLAGILDDGARAELTVIGPAMNALSRIERRAKEEGLEVAASMRFAQLLGPGAGTARARKVARKPGDVETPDVVALVPEPERPCAKWGGKEAA
ncbi:adenylate/guanylate cyclase domain-containing protein [Enterovirga aerilata]|uniref:adenylate/guanylate cyclase domain-containing protein n=1 Tax=Enterovirga aerilata TaxID=2730920 RepID=UPI001AEE2D6D